jgi:protein O-GlcNAc transferase
MRPAAHPIAPNFEQALQLYQQGRLKDAASVCSAILSVEPRHAGSRHLLGILALHDGNAPASAAFLRNSLAIDPGQPDAWCTLSTVLSQLGQKQEALDCTARAVQLAPEDPRVLYAHGNALMAMSRAEEALSNFSAACKLLPGYSKAFNSLGNALLALGRLPDALVAYDGSLQIDANDPDTAFNRANALLALGRAAEAVAAADRAIALDSRMACAHYVRGNALLDQGLPLEALASFDRSIALEPVSAEAHRNRGKALLDLSRLEEALSSLDRALQIRPDYTGAAVNRGNALLQLGRMEDAVAAYRKVLELDPDNVDALSNLGSAFLDTGRSQEMAACFNRLAQSTPGFHYAQGSLLQARLQAMIWSQYGALTRQVVESVSLGRHATAPLWLLSHSDSASLQLQCARTFAADSYPTAAQALCGGRRYAHERIRVAYVSGDFRMHALSLLMAGVFEKHDHERFEFIAVSLKPPQDSPLGRRVQAAFPRFHDLSASSDAEIAAFIRDNEVDIAVDLMGVTSGARTAIFAQRPAPLQVNYLGYPGTLGADFMDYLLADPFVIPPQSREHYQEKIVYLPDCFQANDSARPRDQQRLTRGQLGLPSSGLVLCCFNNTVKVNPPMFDIWCRLLTRVDGAVLWMLADTAAACQTLRREAQNRGVDPARLIFAGRTSYEDYLARMELADLFLDTFPFNAGTTASDALWVGLPVLTCAGEAFASRMAGSLLSTLDLRELITYTTEDYETRALELTTQPARLAAIRARLVSNRDERPLFKTERICRQLEAAFQTMWLRHERGDPPAAFAVPAS